MSPVSNFTVQPNAVVLLEVSPLRQERETGASKDYDPYGRNASLDTIQKFSIQSLRLRY